VNAEAVTYERPSPTLGHSRLLLRDAMSTRAASDWPDPPAGRGRPAMLIPGFLAGDPSLSRMARWLKSGGWKTARSGIRLNVDCMEPTLQALEKRLEEVAELTGKRALVVGQSRGGTFGRVLAVRRPDLVETLITLGSPVLDQMATSRGTRAMVTAVGLLGTVGVPGLFSRSCREGDCCELARAQLSAPISGDVRYLAFYSRHDAIVSWEACLDPAAEQIEASTTHVGMGMNRAVWLQIADLLDQGSRSRPPSSA
jgi:pimeloyl-ACP methyl ester carboxylesterase